MASSVSSRSEVPLAAAAVTGSSEFLLPGRQVGPVSAPLSDSPGAVEQPIERSEDVAGNLLDQPRGVIEAALAHRVWNGVEVADARSDLFERRRVLMDARSCYRPRGMGEEVERLVFGGGGL